MFGIEFAQYFVLQRSLNFTECIGRRLGIQAAQHSACLFNVKLLQNVCNISRVQISQFGVADAELHLRHHAANSGTSPRQC